MILTRMAKEQTLNEAVAKSKPVLQGFDFSLPPELEAGEPPEIRGIARDEVRMMVSHYETDDIQHATFRDFPHFVEPGDVVVINTSATINAAIQAKRGDGRDAVIHLSTHLPGDAWALELRSIDGDSTKHATDGKEGEELELPGGGRANLLTPYKAEASSLWLAKLELGLPVLEYLDRHGAPIRYNYAKQKWPLEYYQTVYATEPGSAEMPSAGRPFTPEIITALAAKGARVVPLVLHTGVSNLEAHEPPNEEYYRVPAETARAVNSAREEGKRVVAVGTTAVRALETVTDARGGTHAGEGWTDLVIGLDTRLRAVNAMLTGLHTPDATHLAMLAALAGESHIRLTYQEALDKKYLWHEFGDVHLILA